MVFRKFVPGGSYSKDFFYVALVAGLVACIFENVFRKSPDTDHLRHVASDAVEGVYFCG